MQNQKIFLLGCGAQKAGTTWISQNLSKSPQYWNAGTKEWRILKYYCDEKARAREVKRLRKIQPKQSKHERKLARLENIDSFFDDVCAQTIASNTLQCLGDMTPSNGLINPEGLMKIQNTFSSRGFKVKPLLLMRDPVERIWSAVKMKLKNNTDGLGDENNEKANEELRRIYRKNHIQNQTCYEKSIVNLEAVFDSVDIHYEFSENLFSQQGLDRIASHCDIDPVVADCQSPNPTTKRLKLDSELRIEIVKFYAGTYEAILKKLGERVPSQWQASYDVL